MLFCGTARRCTKQCLQPFFCIFVQCLVYLFIIFYFLYLFIILYFLYLFIIFFIFVHYFLFYSIYLSIFFIFVCIMNCWSLHPATPATDCGHICSIFSSYSIFVHYLLYLLVFGTAGRCIQQRLQPIVDDCRDNLFLAHKLLSLLCFMYY